MRGSSLGWALGCVEEARPTLLAFDWPRVGLLCPLGDVVREPCAILRLRGRSCSTRRRNPMLTRTQLTELVDAMDRTLDAGGSTTAMQHTATRHREILADYTRDFKRTQTSLREAEQRANLLGSVREEISAFRQSTTSSATEQLLSERGKIDSSNRMTDDILGCVEPPHRLDLTAQASVRDALRVSTATSGAAGRGLAHGRDRDAAAGDQLAHRDDQLAPTTRLDGPRQCRGRLHALPVVYRVWEMRFYGVQYQARFDLLLAAVAASR